MKFSGLPHPGWPKLIAALQKKAHMRQQDIGNKVGVSQSTIAELKTGARTTLYAEAGMRLYSLYADRVLGLKIVTMTNDAKR